MPTIAETRFQMVQLVFPEHANPRGTLYGGRMMSWIATAGTLAASRFAHGPVVLGAMDDLDFLTPVHVGEIVTIDAQVEHVGRSSMEVGVEVWSERPGRAGRRTTTASHLAFIALDDRELPRAVGTAITPGSRAEVAVHEAAAARRAARLARVRSRAEAAGEPVRGGPQMTRASRLVMPEDALSGTLMFAGKLLAVLDEIAGITGARYVQGRTVTASMDTVVFTNPLRVGQIADLCAEVTHVARTSLEVGVEVDGEEPAAGRRTHTCTAYLTMVHVDADGRPVPAPGLRREPGCPLPAEGAAARDRWTAAAARVRARKARVALLRQAAGHDAR